MEVSSSYASSSCSSSPLSSVMDFSSLSTHFRPRFSLLHNHVYHPPVRPSYSSPPPPACKTNSSSSCSSSTFGGGISSIFHTNPYSRCFNSPFLSSTAIITRRGPRGRGRGRRWSWSSPISAVFERFTERAIKAVIFSQREAKSLGKDMVFTQHLLLGLVAEDRSPHGFLGSGITIDIAREAVRVIWNDTSAADDDDDQNEDPSSSSPPPTITTSSSSTDIPFSISTKRVFEAAVEYSRSMGYNFIAPEHISIGLFTADDGSAARVLKR